MPHQPQSQPIKPAHKPQAERDAETRNPKARQDAKSADERARIDAEADRQKADVAQAQNQEQNETQEQHQPERDANSSYAREVDMRHVAHVRTTAIAMRDRLVALQPELADMTSGLAALQDRLQPGVVLSGPDAAIITRLRNMADAALGTLTTLTAEPVAIPPEPVRSAA